MPMRPWIRRALRAGVALGTAALGLAAAADARLDRCGRRALECQLKALQARDRAADKQRVVGLQHEFLGEIDQHIGATFDGDDLAAARDSWNAAAPGSRSAGAKPARRNVTASTLYIRIAWLLFTGYAVSSGISRG